MSRVSRLCEDVVPFTAPTDRLSNREDDTRGYLPVPLTKPMDRPIEYPPRIGKSGNGSAYMPTDRLLNSGATLNRDVLVPLTKPMDRLSNG